MLFKGLLLQKVQYNISSMNDHLFTVYNVGSDYQDYGCPPNFEYSVTRFHFRFVITQYDRLFASDRIVRIVHANNRLIRNSTKTEIIE